tara:strand:- start:545 stop:940 length:396 start_codon:yes stop_codon:yes gene_type:complete
MIVTDHVKEEIQLISIAILMGVIVDSSFSFFDVVDYTNNTTFPYPDDLAPIWILCMWAGFAAQINHVMKRLRGKYLLIGFYGLLAPFAYIGGEAIDAATISNGNINYAIISISWAISLILLFKISEYLMAK